MALPKAPKGFSFTTPQGMANGTTVGHLTDAKTGNVYPVVLNSGGSGSPKVTYPSTGPIGKPMTSGGGLWYSTPNTGAKGTTISSIAPPTGGCQVCQSPEFPLLLVGAAVGVLLLLWFVTRSG